MTYDISLIIPAYNEAARIQQTVNEAVAYFEQTGLHFQIVVAADGDDGTREIVREMAQSDARLSVIGSAERRGKGYGIRQAVPVCEGRIIGFADADNKTPITEFDKCLPLLEQGIEVVIGSRPPGGALIEQKQNWIRRIGSRGYKVFMHLAVGLHRIVDTQCGFKFFQADVARALFNRQKIDGYMFDVEILYLAEQWGYRIEQVQVRWRDDNDSRLNLIAGNIQNVRDTLRIRRLHGSASKSAPVRAITSTQT